MQEIIRGRRQSKGFDGQLARRELKGVAKVNERVTN